MSKTSSNNIVLSVVLDEDKIPESITWKADENPSANAKKAKAMFLSIWDAEAYESLKIDLWTKDMPLQDMKVFFHQVFLSMSETFFKATGDCKMRDTMKDFCEYFAENMDLVNK